MDEGSPVVNHYYKMVTNRAMIPSRVRDEKVGTLIVQYVSNTGEKLRSDVVYEVPYEIRKIYDVFSGKTKVGEESVVEKLTPVYDTTPERFNTIIADKTGFTYEFDTLAVDSAPETSVFDKPRTIVKYVYRLVSKKDQWEVPKDSPIKEVPEYEGGVTLPEAPLKEELEYEGGITPPEAPIKEVPEYEGGVTLPEAPIKEVPEYEGGVTPPEAPIKEIPEYKGGLIVAPLILEVPEYKWGGSLILPSGLEPSNNVEELLGLYPSREPNKVYEILEEESEGRAIIKLKHQENIPTVARLEKEIEHYQDKTIEKNSILPNTGLNAGGTAAGLSMLIAALVLAVRKKSEE